MNRDVIRKRTQAANKPKVAFRSKRVRSKVAKKVAKEDPKSEDSEPEDPPVAGPSVIKSDHLIEDLW